MIMKAFVLGMLGLKASSHFRVHEHRASDEVDRAHSDVVHDLQNQEAVVLAEFELKRRASERISRRLSLGERLAGVVREIHEDAEKLRGALGDAMRRD
jgi:hypothetical protein